MSTLFLATTGGHLQQLDALASRMAVDGDAVWVTDESEQSRSLLDGRDVEFVPFVGVRDVAGVARCVPTAHRIWQERGIDRAVSTGSGIALGYLPYLAARGVDCHYVESATRVTGPSLTGRLLERTPHVHRYAQYRTWTGRRWLYRGNVFDDFAPGPRPRPSSTPLSVVVTVGTAVEYQFPRFLEHLVPLLQEDGALQEATGRPLEVLWQTGCTPTAHLPISPVPFLEGAELRAALRAADLVVSHAGVGSALGALTAGHLPVLASRSPDRGETVDGHQVQLGRELGERGLAIHRDPDAITVDDLLLALESAVHRIGDPPAFELAS
jgi:UDP-N-acetylglucosamine transferase subunit ALG13